MYLRLFHGRTDPNQQMDDWGSDGPLIGPVNISWTYGWLRINGDHLVNYDDLIYFEGVYYGDMEFFSDEDPFVLQEQISKNVITADEFLQRHKRALMVKDHPAETTKIAVIMDKGIIHEIISTSPNILIKIIDFDVFNDIGPEDKIPYNEMNYKAPDRITSSRLLNSVYKANWDIAYKNSK